MLSASEIARLLIEWGLHVEFQGESPYKSRAYRRAAESLLVQPVSVGELVEQGQLRRVPGIGAALAEKIEVLYRTGTHPQLETLRAEMPASALSMLAVPGVTPARLRILHRTL